MIPRPPIAGFARLVAALIAVGCGPTPPSSESASAIIDPPAQCSAGRPDCSVSSDFPTGSELTPDNSSGLRFSEESGALVLDRASVLPDSDGDGVPDDADDCPGTPDWISCDDDPTNDGLYATLFYDPTGADESLRRAVLSTVAEIPQIDVYFLIDATPTLADEIVALQEELESIVDEVRAEFGDARFGVGLYRAYPLSELGEPFSQSPYHHVLDLTDDDALLSTAVNTLDTVSNLNPAATSATQALYSVASGMGIGDFVPNRGSCTGDGEIGYPCFRPNSLHVVMNITDSEVFNGPRATGPTYGDPPFGSGVGVGGTTLPPAEMFVELFDSDDAEKALDLGDRSNQSLTLLGMSGLLTNAVDTELAPGCAPSPPPTDPPPIDPPDLPGADMDWKDVVLALRFDAPVPPVTAFANNTHWPGANVALFDDALLDPLAALACDGGEVGVGHWGQIAWNPVPAQQYYLVIDGIIPNTEPDLEPEGAFSISIVHDGDPPNPAWTTTDAPVVWADVETALLASEVRVASVVTLRDAMTIGSRGAEDAGLLAAATDALTAGDAPWVGETDRDDGVGLGSAVTDTLLLISTDSVYDVSVIDADNDTTPFDERVFVRRIRWDHCATDDDDLFQCSGAGALNRCLDCELSAELDFAVSLQNQTVEPTAASQVFDFEVIVQLDGSVEIERVPVRVMVPDADAHVFQSSSGPSFYQNSYDTTARCITPPERPKWSDLTWSGTTPAGTSIEFQIRTANEESELGDATPAIVRIPADTEESTFNISDELIAAGELTGLPYLRITAVLRSSSSPPASPTLEGWSFEFFCEPAE